MPRSRPTPTCCVVLLVACFGLSALGPGCAPRTVQQGPQTADTPGEAGSRGSSGASTSEATPRPGGGKRHALLVGVDVYRHGGVSSLKGAENDVEELAKLLDKQGFAVRLLTTARGREKEADAPTAANLRKELDALLTNKEGDDTVLIALAGHGAEVEVPHPDDSDKEKKRTKSYTYFIPSDGNLEKISYSTGHSDRLIELGSLFDRLGPGADKCGAGAKLVLIDACRDRQQAKSSTRRTRGLSPTHVTVPAGVNALFSCGPEEEALEMRFLPEGADDYRFHGVFFWHVIEGLRGAAANRRGSVNWSDLTSYVQDEVPAYVRKAARELKQPLPPQNPHAVVNAQRPVVLVASLSPAAEGKKEKPAEEKVVPAGKAVVSSIGMRLVWIPKGTFTMGSPAGEKERNDDEGPQHEVEIARPFHLSETEVTQSQFKAVMGYNPSFFSKAGSGKAGVKYPVRPAGGQFWMRGSTDDYPVENVSWEDAMEFCVRLSSKDRKEGIIGSDLRYRLPTEAEWEYACRGGAPSYQVFHFGNSLSSRQANVHGLYPYGGASKGPYLGRTTRVGSYQKNGFGLYDMHGNVWEWCYDRYGADYYKSSPRRDPTGPITGSTRVLRGGCWGDGPQYGRSADRRDGAQSDRYQNFGFRVALVPSGQ